MSQSVPRKARVWGKEAYTSAISILSRFDGPQTTFPPSLCPLKVASGPFIIVPFYLVPLFFLKSALILLLNPSHNQFVSSSSSSVHGRHH